MSDLLSWIEGHPGTAAWLQGIFTVVAVAVAIWAPWRHDRENERQERQRKIDCLVAMADEAEMLLGDALTYGQSTAGRPRFVAERVDAASWNYLRQAVASVPLHDLPRYEIVHAVMQLRRALDLFHAMLEGIEVSEEDSVDAFDWLEHLTNLANEINEACGVLREQQVK